MKKWEYKTIHMSGKMVSRTPPRMVGSVEVKEEQWKIELREAGMAGWELVATTAYHLFLKR